MAILILAEHDGNKLTNASYATVGAAQLISKEIDMLVAGHNAAAVFANAARCAGVNNILTCDDEAYAAPLAENLAWLIHSVVKAGNYSHVMAPANTYGKDILPRAAALCDSQQISDIIEIVSDDCFKRPIYAGNAIETVKSSDAIKFITVRPTAFDKVAEDSGSAELKIVPAAGIYQKSKFIELQQTKSERPELTAANIVVSGGRGLGSKENFEKIINPLADKLGAAIGASRAAVDAGYVPNDYQVGQTGKVVAPSLYIAIGISGAIQHIAGMKDSKIIVAINKDENAPIFDIADYGLVADLFEAVPELTDKL